MIAFARQHGARVLSMKGRAATIAQGPMKDKVLHPHPKRRDGVMGPDRFAAHRKAAAVPVVIR
jgi:hypothetical protein